MTCHELSVDVAVIGGGVGGCAAALAAADAGVSVVLVEPTDWIGGQLTTQITPPDEHGWIERFGCTASYRRFRDGVRSYYRTHYPLTDAARANPRLNPGNGWVSPLCHEPRVALAVLEGLLAPHVASGRLQILRRHSLARVIDGGADRLRGVELRDHETGAARVIEARWLLDATELGDLIGLGGVESVTGAESQAMTGEPSAPAAASPTNAQAFSVCCVLDHDEDADHTIERPARYDYWRTYVPPVTPAWTGRLFSWEAPHPRTMDVVRYRFAPNRERARAFEGLWSYRRILDRHNFEAGRYDSDLCVINWVLLDFIGGDLVTADEPTRASLEAEAREQTRSVVYWLQTEAPREDGGQGWRGLRLRGDVTGTSDGLAMSPYIRESRRVVALTTIREQDVSAAERPGERLGERYADSIGVGYYRIDLHPSVGGDNYVDVAALPFRIPLRALVPRRVDNVLAAGKCLGTTHITNGCYRLHPVEWNIGEAAGALAAFCIQKHRTGQAVCDDERLVGEFQQLLVRRGVELAWPEGLDLDDGDPHAHAR
ncbi:MAG TPA: FAD-dependent oxidoreductase [Luteitalea sp.]|nr:FAD-dependent oxidoreductase [Luteitalea sp.]